jgi:hypothetical protein
MLFILSRRLYRRPVLTLLGDEANTQGATCVLDNLSNRTLDTAIVGDQLISDLNHVASFLVVVSVYFTGGGGTCQDFPPTVI